MELTPKQYVYQNIELSVNQLKYLLSKKFIAVDKQSFSMARLQETIAALPGVIPPDEWHRIDTTFYFMTEEQAVMFKIMTSDDAHKLRWDNEI